MDGFPWKHGDLFHEQLWNIAAVSMHTKKEGCQPETEFGSRCLGFVFVGMAPLALKDLYL
jgi:hypothetical protein